MNPLIETLNHWGQLAANIVWPIFWQSSLLIALVFLLDLVLRRRLRAAIRYALWLVVLVKLVLPPSLALPTAAAWWLRPVKQLTIAPPISRPTPTVLRWEQPAISETIVIPTPTILVPPPRAHLSAAGEGLVIWIAVGTALLAWMLRRWWQITREVRQTTPPTEALTELRDQAQRDAGLRHAPRLRLTDRAMSPAVCGLWRPVIVLPRSLAKQLSSTQLRAVLLHEMIHLRRGDVWINCLQTLLQVICWWHPFLWLANARIRSLREEAVDDAVMLALREEADTYAPTLLEVAKLALNRPLISLGFVGILESRSALRHRIERLMDFRAPRRAGLTFGSILGICAFTLVAAPMREAPPKLANLVQLVTIENPAANPTLPEPGPAQTSALADTPGNSVPTPPPTPSESIAASPDEKASVEKPPNPAPDLPVNSKTQLAPFLDQTAPTVRVVEIGQTTLVQPTDQSTPAATPKPPQILIEAKFIELPEAAVEQFWKTLGVAKPGVGSRRTLLAAAQTRNVLKSFQNKKGIEILSAPSITTFSGSQAQAQMVEIKSIVLQQPRGSTNWTNTGSPYKVQTMPFGPTLDVIPRVAGGGGAIDMQVIPTLTEFLGYTGSGNAPPLPPKQARGEAPISASSRPKLRTRQLVLNQTIPNGQTLALGDFNGEYAYPPEDLKSAAQSGMIFVPGEKQKRLLVLVTATIVESTGNPEHTRIQTLLQDANLLRENGQLDGAEKKVKEAIAADPKNMTAFQMLNMVKDAREAIAQHERMQVGNNNPIRPASEVLNKPPALVRIQTKFVEITQIESRGTRIDGVLVSNVLLNGGRMIMQGGTAPAYPGDPSINGPANPFGTFPGTFGVAQNAGSLATNSLLTSGIRNVIQNGSNPSSNAAPAIMRGVLTEPQFRVVMRALEQRGGVDIHSPLNLTTASGRRAEIQLWRTNTAPQKFMEEGLSVLPEVASNSEDIQMAVTSYVQYIGANDPQGADAQRNAAPHLPRLPNLEVPAMNIRDGQTLVIGGIQSASAPSGSKQMMMIFITPTLVDAAGNPIHPETRPPP